MARSLTPHIIAAGALVFAAWTWTQVHELGERVSLMEEQASTQYARVDFLEGLAATQNEAAICLGAFVPPGETRQRERCVVSYGTMLEYHRELLRLSRNRDG